MRMVMFPVSLENTSPAPMGKDTQRWQCLAL